MIMTYDSFFLLLLFFIYLFIFFFNIKFEYFLILDKYINRN